MGACDVGGTFKAYDWRSGIQRVIEDAEAYYGHQEGYSGAANSCSFSYKGDKSSLTKKELNAYIDSRMDNLGKRDGEVILVGIEGYDIIKTEYVPQTVDDPLFIKRLFVGQKGPALLLVYDWRSNNYKIERAGTIAEMKALAHIRLRSENYEKNYTILTKKGKIVCKGVVTNVKKTTRKTDEKNLILPIYKYMYYGWAAC